MRVGYVYIMSNYTRTTFYIGVTSDLAKRVYEHQTGFYAGFTKRYQFKYLVYYEHAGTIVEAITREKQLKNWHREWKINLVRSLNPEMKDLSSEIL